MASAPYTLPFRPRPLVDRRLKTRSGFPGERHRGLYAAAVRARCARRPPLPLGLQRKRSVRPRAHDGAGGGSGAAAAMTLAGPRGSSRGRGQTGGATLLGVPAGSEGRHSSGMWRDFSAGYPPGVGRRRRRLRRGGREPGVYAQGTPPDVRGHGPFDPPWLRSHLASVPESRPRWRARLTVGRVCLHQPRTASATYIR